VKVIIRKPPDAAAEQAKDRQHGGSPSGRGNSSGRHLLDPHLTMVRQS
jgi:hypothetical protein